MEYTVSDASRRPDEPAHMKPVEPGDVECRRPNPGPELVLARQVRRVDFTVRPIAAGGLQSRRDGREMDIHADGAAEGGVRA